MKLSFSNVWNELRKLRYLRVQGHWSFRNYWFGEDMPCFRHVPWLCRLVEGSRA